jgi:hypothetical protein
MDAPPLIPLNFISTCPVDLLRAKFMGIILFLSSGFSSRFSSRA